MRRQTFPEGIQSPASSTRLGEQNRPIPRIRKRIAISAWGMGLMLFVVSCFLIHAHPQPYPFDLAVTRALTPLQDVPWAGTILLIPGFMNDTVPSIIMLAVVCGGMLLVGEVRRRRGKSANLWFQSAIFLAICVPLSTAINLLVAYLVNRPRPSSLTAPIKHHTQLIGIPTYPSGHTEHSVVFYGLLLYLSLSKPVRTWRYRWLLLPLQLYAAFDILSIGVSRIVAEDHWITDALGGYLIAGLELSAYIFLYQWVIQRRRVKQEATTPG